MPALFRSSIPAISPVKIKASESTPLLYGSLLEIGLQILKSVKSLHQHAKLIHGCIGPNSVALLENGMFRFQACVRSVLIESGEVIPFVLDGVCPHFYPREFISP